MTILFDDKSMFKSVPNIMKILIRDHDTCAKDYLKARSLKPAEMELLSEFGHYTIEALIVHVLSVLFSAQEDTTVRITYLVEQLEYSVRSQAALLKSRRCNTPYSMPKDIGLKIKDLKGRKIAKLEMMYP